jgi:hypothetical protein
MLPSKASTSNKEDEVKPKRASKDQNGLPVSEWIPNPPHQCFILNAIAEEGLEFCLAMHLSFSSPVQPLT